MALLICPICHEKFSTMEVLEEHHCNYHRHDKIFECRQCDNRFSWWDTFLHHQQVHVRRRERSSFFCPFCFRSFEELQATRVHAFTCCLRSEETLIRMKTVYKLDNATENSEIRSYTCTKCKENFLTVGQLLEHHRYYHHSTICDLCDQTLDNRVMLINHLQAVHHRSEGLSCAVCKATFTCVDDLLYHKAFHIEDVMSCSYCLEQFISDKELKEHVEQEHKNAEFQKDGKFFTCHVCGRRFLYDFMLLSHLKSHNQYGSTENTTVTRQLTTKNDALIDPSKCTDIDNIVNVSVENDVLISNTKKMPNYIQKDVDININEIPPMPSRFGGRPRKHRLNEKKRKLADEEACKYDLAMTDEQPYLCAVCGRSFRWEISLQIHHREHEQVTKPYDILSTSSVTNLPRLQCSFCSLSYTRNCDLDAHLSRVHNVMLEKSSENVTASDLKSTVTIPLCIDTISSVVCNSRSVLLKNVTALLAPLSSSSSTATQASVAYENSTTVDDFGDSLATFASNTLTRSDDGDVHQHDDQSRLETCTQIEMLKTPHGNSDALVLPGLLETITAEIPTLNVDVDSTQLSVCDEAKPVSISIDTWCSDMLNAFYTMHLNGLLCDVMLVSSDSMSIFAHGALIAAACPNLRQLLSQGQGSYGAGVLVLKFDTISSDTWQILLTFVYTSRVDVLQTQLPSLLAAAEQLHFQTMIDFCRKMVEVVGSRASSLSNEQQSFTLQLSSVEWSHKIMHELNNLRLSNTLCQMTIVTSDLTAIMCHGIVIAAASPVLRSSLATADVGLGLSTCTDSISLAVWQQLLNFVYTGCVDVYDFDSLITATTHLQITVLEKACLDYLTGLSTSVLASH